MGKFAEKCTRSAREKGSFYETIIYHEVTKI